jgi:hypothetical protein
MDAMDQYAGSEREPLRRRRPAADPLDQRPDQRMDRWVSAGRQFVEGVAGSRPGGRPAARSGDRRVPRRLRLDDLGRWVEDRLDWLLEDGDGWREPWQEEGRGAPSSSTAAQVPSPAAPLGSRRQGLEAVSRRGRSADPVAPVPGPRSSALADQTHANAGDNDWPEDASFTVPRWQRPERPLSRTPAPSSEIAQPSQPEAVPVSRPLPRSSRRRY